MKRYFTEPMFTGVVVGIIVGCALSFLYFTYIPASPCMVHTSHGDIEIHEGSK